MPKIKAILIPKKLRGERLFWSSSEAYSSPTTISMGFAVYKIVESGQAGQVTIASTCT
jgi:hypothetical protein